MANEFANTQNLVVIDDIRNNTIVLKDGSLRQVLLVTGVNVALKSESEQGVLTTSYQNFLNSVDFPLEIVVHSRKVNIEKYLKRLEARSNEEPSSLLQNQITEHKKFIESFVTDNAIMEKIFLVVISFAPFALPSTNSITKFIPFLKKSKSDEATQAAQDKATSLSENVAQLTQRVTQVAEGLRSVGLEAEPLGDEELVELFYNFYNPETIEKEKITLPT
jgi:type IV secretory pathway VirB4 component